MKNKIMGIMAATAYFALFACNAATDSANTDTIINAHRDSMPVLKPPVTDTKSAVITPPINDPNVVKPDSNQQR